MKCHYCGSQPEVLIESSRKVFRQLKSGARGKTFRYQPMKICGTCLAERTVASAMKGEIHGIRPASHKACPPARG